jgi:hypothetical protein
VALLGALLADHAGGGRGGRSLSLQVPLIVATCGYLAAVTLAWFATRPDS